MKRINIRKFLLNPTIREISVDEVASPIKYVSDNEYIPNKKTENAIKDADHIWSDCKLKKLRKRRKRLFK